MVSTTKALPGIFLSAAIALTSGCASTAPATPAAQPAPQPSNPVASTAPPPAPIFTPAPTQANDNRVIIDGPLRNLLRVTKVLSSPGADGLLKIEVDVQNLTGSPLKFDYQVEWFNEEGERLDLPSHGPWSWMLLAHETAPIVETAPAMTAKDFGVGFMAATN